MPHKRRAVNSGGLGMVVGGARPGVNAAVNLSASRMGEEKVKEYAVVYESGPNNWSAYVPDLPGCITTGRTREETEANIREAIEFHIEGLKAHGLPVPEPTCEAGMVAVAA